MTKEKTLTEKIDIERAEDQQLEGTIPIPAPQVAEIVPPKPGEGLLAISLTVTELAAIAASIQLCVHVHAISTPSALNVANSVLRKIHDAKVRFVALEGLSDAYKDG